MLGMQIIGSAGLLQLDSFGGCVLFVIGFGVTGGILGLLAGVIWPRFYGRRNLGAIEYV